MANFNTNPLVYSCAGCTHGAQIANDIATWLHREGVAEMSCISGISGCVHELLSVAHSGREILALDGCAQRCVHKILQQQSIEPTWHVDLTDVLEEKIDTVNNPNKEYSLTDTYHALEYVYAKLSLGKVTTSLPKL